MKSYLARAAGLLIAGIIAPVLAASLVPAILGGGDIAEAHRYRDNDGVPLVNCSARIRTSRIPVQYNADSRMRAATDYALSVWNNPNTPIGFRYVSSGERVEVRDANISRWGEFNPFSQTFEPGMNVWCLWFGIVTYDTSLLSASLNFQKQVACHEFGHALGLGHNGEATSCMNSDSGSRVPSGNDLRDLIDYYRPGNLNGDRRVNVLDLGILLSRWNRVNNAADINEDGVIDVVDLSMLLTNWGEGSPGTNSASGVTTGPLVMCFHSFG